MRADIENQPHVLSLADLQKIKSQKRDGCVMDASHYHLVSGVLVQEPKQDFEKDVKKLLGRRILDKSKLIKALAEQEIRQSIRIK